MISRIFMSGMVLAVTLAVFLSPAQAQPITHLNQNIGDHVILVADAVPKGEGVCHTLAFQDRGLFRVFPDGTQSKTVFQVPRGHLLVVTDVEWSAYGGPNGTIALQPGRTLRLVIGLGDFNFPTPVVFQSTGVTLDADSANGRPGTSEQLTAGFVVGSGVPLCPSAGQVEPNFVATAFIDRLILRGYLIRAEE